MENTVISPEEFYEKVMRAEEDFWLYLKYEDEMGPYHSVAYISPGVGYMANGNTFTHLGTILKELRSRKTIILEMRRVTISEPL